MDIPIFLVTGFLESGKTSFIKETLSDPEFQDGVKTLLIVFEEGIEEYEKEFLDKYKIDLVVVEDEEDLTDSFFMDCNEKYKPHRVMIEFNGVMKLETIFKLKMPEEWALAQIISTVDASLFELQMSNMRSMMVEQLTNSDLIIFNRCTPETNKLTFRRTIKLFNRSAQLIYESEDGEIDDNVEEELPYDINAEFIDICDDDYGIWYMDAMDNPQKYHGKTVKIKGMVYKGKGFPNDYFVPGRFAMTCCEDDTTFIGFLCRSKYAKTLQNKDWITVTAEMKFEYHPGYGKESIVLYSKKIEKAEKPEEELVYFT